LGSRILFQRLTNSSLNGSKFYFWGVVVRNIGILFSSQNHQPKLKSSTMKVLLLYFLSLWMPIHAFEIWASEESKNFWDHQSSQLRAQGFSKGFLARSNNRIIGGTNAIRGRYPYYAYLEVQTNENTFFCSGTLIWEDILLSAAHCIVDIEQQGLSILRMDAYVGLHNRKRAKRSEMREISIAVPHPSYNMLTDENDILLFKLNSSVLSIYPVMLNLNASEPANGQSVDTIGFGRVSESKNTTLPSILQTVTTNVIPFQDCNDANSYNGGINNELMICAGITEGGKVR
jgi:hypothetical protein